MRIILASKNPVKIKALQDVMPAYEFLKDTEIISCEANSGVSDQPKSLEETISGAINRARKAYNKQYAYSFGIESGLIEVPYTPLMDICFCVVYDGKEQSIGSSVAFEVPVLVSSIVIEKNMNLTQACYEAKLTSSKTIGSAEGIIGLLTKGRVTRKDYTKQAIQMALIPWENAQLYF